jgi:hypothetical protein
MSEVIVHACSTLCNPDRLTDQQVREELKRATDELFSKDLQLIELKAQVHALNNILVKLAELQVADRFEDLQSEMQRLAAHYQQQKAVQSARQVH